MTFCPCVCAIKTDFRFPIGTKGKTHKKDIFFCKSKQERKEKLKQGKEKAFLRLNHDFELIESRCCCRTDCAFGHSGNFFSSHCEITLHCFLVEKAKNCTKPLVLNTTFVPIKNSHRFVSKM